MAVSGIGSPAADGRYDQELAHAIGRRTLIGLHQVTDAVAVVDPGSPEPGRVDLLAERLAHDAGTREEHRGILGHQHQIGQCG